MSSLGHTLTEVRITELTDGVFFAVLAFEGGVEVSARPSDAIALALRTGTPIYGAETVLEAAGIAVPDEQEDEVGSSGPSSTRSRRTTSSAGTPPPSRADPGSDSVQPSTST